MQIPGPIHAPSSGRCALRQTVVLIPLALVLGGCSMLSQTNQQLDEGARAPGRTMEMGKAIDTNNNINSINQALSMVKTDNDGKAPETLEEAKRAARVPDSMWIDSETGKPLAYDPVSGTVHREGAAPNSPSVAGASNAPSSLKGPNGGAGDGGF